MTTSLHWFIFLWIAAIYLFFIILLFIYSYIYSFILSFFNRMYCRDAFVNLVKHCIRTIKTILFYLIIHFFSVTDYSYIYFAIKLRKAVTCRISYSPTLNVHMCSAATSEQLMTTDNWSNLWLNHHFWKVVAYSKLSSIYQLSLACLENKNY